MTYTYIYIHTHIYALAYVLLAFPAGMDLNTSFLKLSHICQVDAPLAGTARYLAGLYQVCAQPSGKVIWHTKPVVMSSVW
jgi:hypothetical protein